MNSVEPIIIKGREDLEYLLRKNTFHFFPRPYPRIILQFDQLAPVENDRFSKKMNFFYYSCGCSEGALFLFVGLIAYLACLLLLFWGEISYLHIMGGLLFLFLLSGIGKAFGLIRAKIRLKHLIKKLIKLI